MVADSSTTGSAIKDNTTIQTEEEQQYASQMGWGVLFTFTTKKHLPVMLGAILTAAVSAATLPVFSIIYGLIFNSYADYGAGNTDGDELLRDVTRYCLILTGVATANWIMNSTSFFFMLIFGELQAKSARTRVFDVLIRKDITWFDLRESGIAAFLPTIQSHIRDLQLSVSIPFGDGLQYAIAAIAALGVAFYFSWKLTLVVVCTVPLMYIIQLLLSKKMESRANEQADQLQAALKFATNAISSIETVKCFNGERTELNTFTKLTVLSADLYRGVANIRSMQIGIIQFFTLCVFVQGFWYGSHLITTGDMDAGAVITTFWAALLAIANITGFLPQLIVMQKGKMSGAKLRVVMDKISGNNEQHEALGDQKPLQCLGRLEFKDVSFSYPTRADEVAIRDVSALFPAGETVFVIGKSGSGKSTLGQLLVRFYQPSSGQILLDDVPLNSLDVQWLRNNITLVEQHSVLFNDTIRQNLALGNPTKVVSPKETSDAIDFALLSQVVQELPEGLDTHLGMKGSSLSGGQRQRLALARANIRDTPILILDESTSALDYITRATILQAIRNWRRGKTTIIITHDISQIESDDFLYLLDNAELHEKGYRRDLETKFSLFNSLLVSHEKEDIDGEYLSEDESSEDELMPTYDQPWDAPTPRRRPLSAIGFGESVISPLLTSASKRLSSYERENNPEEATRSFLAIPGTSEFSAAFESAVNEFELKEYGSKRSSIGSRLSMHTQNQQTSAYPPLQRSHSRNGSRPPSRPGPRPGSRPTSMLSREDSYPRRLSVVSERVAPLDSNNTCWRRTRFRRKIKPLDTRKSAEEQVTSPGSLGIREILGTVWPNVNWKSRVTLIVGVFATFVHAAATPVFSWVFSQLLTTLYTPGDQRQAAVTWALVILAIAILDGVSSYLMFYLFDQVAQSWTQALKVEAMKRILAQPREFFNKEENSITRITGVLDHSAEEARNLPGRFVGVFLAMFFMIIISVLWTLSICWKLALVALASGPILYGITQVYNMIASHWERLVSEADDNVAQVLHETFVNIRTVRCLTLEDVFRKKYEEVTTSALNVGLKRAIYSGSIFGLNMSGPLFVAVALFWYGAYVVSRNEYSVPAITETFLILMLSINHISQMSNYMTQINISREAGSRLIRLVRLPASSHEDKGTIKVETAGDISFKNVNFAYPNRIEHPILHNLSLSIARGSCTAIVGSSGSGKSTVAALLLKLYPIDQRSFGSTRDLTVSNHDIKALHTTTLRSKMAMVSQTPVLFPGTIAHNIAYGLSPSSPQATLASIRAAGEAAGVGDFIDSLPQGYQTVIGDGGTNLSGGQAQRIAIARALVRDPDVLILDESTSALDISSANVVRETIQKLVAGNKTGRHVPGSRAGGAWDDKEMGGRGEARARKQMTVIIITHAREMMMIADQIIMLDKGRVIEEGSFSELKKRKGSAFGRLLRGEAE